MPRFFLHVHDDVGTFDEEGMELPHLNDAFGQAAAGLRCVVAEQVRNGRLPVNWYVSIEDATGGRVGVVNFLEAVEICVQTGQGDHLASHNIIRSLS